MPRYLLTREDLDDLVFFLKALGSDADPGLTDRAIVVGTILPPSSSLGELSRAVRSVLVAYFEEVNRRGGLYGRRLELRCAEAPEASEDRLGEARRFLGRRDTFALVAPFLAGAEDAVAEAARAENVPVVGPFTSSPKSGSPPNRYVFYLHSSLADQARALALFADGRLAGRKPSAILLFAEDDEEARSASQAVRAECLRLGWGRVEGPSRVPPDQPDRMKFDVAFVLSPGCREVEGLLAAGPTGRGPLVLIPGALAGKEVLDWASDVRDRLFLSFPTLPLDISPDGSAEYGRLAAAYKLPEGYRSSQIEALAAAKVLVEALTAAGRGVGRETLIDQLEHFYQRPTGLTRPITFGPNRRFGTRGAYIAGVAASRAKLVPVGGYIEPPLR
jgi:ABC-type branched-subunit amino acid transport system substrate-binding protein